LFGPNRHQESIKPESAASPKIELSRPVSNDVEQRVKGNNWRIGRSGLPNLTAIVEAKSHRLSSPGWRQ
jgi:hypothetical protein